VSEKSIELSHAEIQAIKKAIQYLKFKCEETESVLFASSPHINSVLEKVLAEDSFGAGEKDFYDKKLAFEVNQSFAMSKINRLAAEESRKISDEEMKAVLKEYLYPYSI